jgi:hypothetical protein
MPFQGFEGPAGTGKTHQLMEAVVERITQDPLLPHQRVLALTFMHGSRRRLEGRFAGLTAVQGRYQCTTIDSFAGYVAQRWQTLCDRFNIGIGGFEETCDCGGRLLEEPAVAHWVAAAYPVVVVDEAQELSPARLRIVKALAPYVSLFVAADEFQCLDENIDTSPFMEWFGTGRITPLEKVHRTSQRGLLDGAGALRNGLAPTTDGHSLKISYQFSNQAPFAIGHALHNARRRGGEIAVIVAPGGRGWIDPLLPRFCEGFSSKSQTIYPLRIGWEVRPSEEIERVTKSLGEAPVLTDTDVVAALDSLEEPPIWVSAVLVAIRHQRRACNQSTWTAEALQDLVERKAAHHRAYSYSRPSGIPVMTIHGAKNREFRHVVLLWPHGVRGDALRQRRLLYNAITRAEETCTVFVRGEELLRAPPFG